MAILAFARDAEVFAAIASVSFILDFYSSRGIWWKRSSGFVHKVKLFEGHIFANVGSSRGVSILYLIIVRANAGIFPDVGIFETVHAAQNLGFFK